MRKLLFGLAGAAALAFSTAGQAQLTVIDAQTTVDVDTIVQSGMDFHFGYDDEFGTSEFNEMLTFDNNAAGNYTISLISSTLGLDFQLVTLSGMDIVPIELTGGTIAGFEAFGLPLTSLGAGTYTLNIQGQSPLGGSFGGDVNFYAVPEPATWAMLLIGFGAIGSQIRRRRQRPQVQYA